MQVFVATGSRYRFVNNFLWIVFGTAQKKNAQSEKK
jgi:hypothetical protein